MSVPERHSQRLTWSERIEWIDISVLKETLDVRVSVWTYMCASLKVWHEEDKEKFLISRANENAVTASSSMQFKATEILYSAQTMTLGSFNCIRSWFKKGTIPPLKWHKHDFSRDCSFRQDICSPVKPNVKLKWKPFDPLSLCAHNSYFQTKDFGYLSSTVLKVSIGRYFRRKTQRQRVGRRRNLVEILRDWCWSWEFRAFTWHVPSHKLVWK